MARPGIARAALLALVAQAGMAGGAVTVLGVWGGQELEAFNELARAFEQQTGVKVEFTGTRDLNAVLTTRISAGDPPDLAVLPDPARMAELAAQGRLVDLGGVLDLADFRSSYAPVWAALGSARNKLVGIVVKATLKGLVWYGPRALHEAGLRVPESFDQLMAASSALAARGTTPWTVGIESGSASGWVGADWIATLFLRMHGPGKYAEWHQGRLPWTSPEMREVWRAWGRIVGDPKMVYGGGRYVLSTPFGNAFAPLFQSPPRALFHFQAAFIQGFIHKQFPRLKPGEDFDFFPFPAIRPEFARAEVIAGDLLAMLRRTPQSEAFIRYLASAPAQRVWAKSGAGLSANRNVPLGAYLDPVSRKAAERLTRIEAAVFGAGDLMPSQMSSAFWSACMDFVANPGDLEAILAQLEAVRRDAYASGAPP